MIEKWEILDDYGNSTGEVLERNNPRVWDKGIYHLASDVWILNSENKILIQKRSEQKKLEPNVWAMTGGSVIFGETPKETIVREAKEELDIDINPNDLQLITKIKSLNVWVNTYLLKCDYDISKMKFQPDEVSDVKWATWEEIDNFVKQGKFIKYRWEFVSEILNNEIKKEEV